MLRPDERQHLLELLRPPVDCKLDVAVGTTFSLDLMSALMLPLSFAFFDWEQADGELVADPLALLEALRRYGDRFTVFCQSGQIRLPPKYQPLVTFLEPCIYDVQLEDPDGVFHPKVWAMRFVAEDGAVRYRVLCLSRNLTFDRCWDTVVALDGELTDRSNAIAANHPLADFIAALPGLAGHALPRGRRQGVAKIADELRRVRFKWPDGFDENECRFWVAGLEGKAVTPFGERQDKALIVSPFLSNPIVRDFLDHTEEMHLVSRPESIQELPQETLQRCKSVSFLAPELTDESDDGSPPLERDEVLDGLHAKLFVIDRGWNASVFSGSFNATVHALQHNVEFMVELVGKKSRFGVDQFLRQVKGETNFADLLKAYDRNAAPVPADATAQKLDDLLHATKRALATAGPRLVVTPASEIDSFDMSMEWTRAPHWPHTAVEIRAWPITQQAERAQTLNKSMVFPRLSYGGLTPLIAFAMTAKHGEAKRESIFVMNLPLQGAPEDRQDRIVRSLIENRDQLLRYILFLLASGDEMAAASGDLRKLLTSQEDGPGRASANPYLLETLLRALHRSPAQLERVSSLLAVLRKQPGSSELLSDDFRKIWEPIWDAARQVMEK
ncbi:MAG: phospholipase D family protein [Nitrospirota bacterium]|nr:phospholipase D family protein [Nitrospirota bacterium]MDP2382508.1 phospholipase D family protein [Nitrospirota bacterium]